MLSQIPFIATKIHLNILTNIFNIDVCNFLNTLVWYANLQVFLYCLFDYHVSGVFYIECFEEVLNLSINLIKYFLQCCFSLRKHIVTVVALTSFNRLLDWFTSFYSHNYYCRCRLCKQLFDVVLLRRKSFQS